MPRQVNNSHYNRAIHQLLRCEDAIVLWEIGHRTIDITPDEVMGKLKWLCQWFPPLRQSAYALQVRLLMLRFAVVIDGSNKPASVDNRR